MPDLAELIGSTIRDRDKLIGGVARHLILSNALDDYALRGVNGIHPSEAARPNWCLRATYYRLTGVKSDPIAHTLAMELVFGIGDDAHRKWQRWFREMNILRGMWRCLSCGLLWEAENPHECPRCEIGDDLIRYAEVPLRNDDYLLIGSADGDVLREEGCWTLVEIKTIGTGTLRYEAPSLVKKHTYTHIDESGKKHTGTDWYALWSGIHGPFPSHIKQGMIYCFCKERKEIVYIYEPKFLTAHPKEFKIKFRRDIIEDVLDDCRLVRRALDTQRRPKRPMWAEDENTSTCKECPYRKTCWGAK